jgi:hypothetical protein
VQRASDRVKAFFDQYESNIGGSDPAAIAAQYGESFVFFKSVGLRSSSVVALEEASLDDLCVLVKVQWRMQFGAATAPVAALDLFATYLLQQQPDGLRIVFQLDHDDLTKRVQELGLV